MFQDLMSQKDSTEKVELIICSFRNGEAGLIEWNSLWEST